MPLPSNLFYVRTVFQLRSGGQAVDTASFGYHMVSSSGSGTPPLDDLAELARDTWITNDFGTPSYYSSSVVADHVDAYKVGTDGHVTAKGSAAFTSPDDWAGSGTDGLPWQDSLVISLYGFDPSGFAAERGRKRGRIYLPPLDVSRLAEDGRITGGTQTTMVAGAKAYFDAMNASSLGGWNFVTQVMSTAAQDVTEVTHIRVGEAVDTQRRRRNKLPEAYAQAALA